MRQGDQALGQTLEPGEQRRAETVLRQSEELLRKVLDALPVGVWVTDAVGKIILGNPAGQRVWAGARYVGIEEYHEYKGWRVDTGELIAAEEWALARAVRKGETSLDELIEIECFDGTRKIILNSAAPVRDEEGRIIGAIVLNEDVTERRRLESEREEFLAALSDERRWLQSVIERSPVGILLCKGKDAEQLVANRRAVELLGQPAPPAGGLPLLRDRILKPDGAPHAAGELALEQALRGETVSGREQIIRRPDGTDVPVLTNASPIRSAQGELLGAVVTYEDITPLKDLERLREEWTSVVAHDLRQPLTGMMGTAALLARQLDNAEARSKAERILASAGRMNRMINDLLDVSQLEARRLELQRAETDLPALLARVMEQVGQGAEQGRLSLSVSGDIPLVLVDPHRIEQVMENLLTNALKYGAPGTPIDVTVERCGGEVVVSVRNRGPGLAPSDLPLLFERFQRGRARASPIKGLGLGLYICRGLVEAHGGRITVESVPDQVTTFSFTLPLTAAAPAGAR